MWPISNQKVLAELNLRTSYWGRRAGHLFPGYKTASQKHIPFLAHPQFPEVVLKWHLHPGGCSTAQGQATLFCFLNVIFTLRRKLLGSGHLQKVSV